MILFRRNGGSIVRWNNNKGDMFAAAPPELLELADRVRYILNTYPPNDPVVREIRQSEAYRRVAYLIEAPYVPWLM